MRKIAILIGLCALIASALTITGQQAPQDLSPVMKGIAHETQELNKAMNATGVPIVVQEAEKLQRLFGQAEAFFKAKNVPDAVNLAKAQQESAAAIMRIAQANNLDGAKAPIKAMMDRCQTCHMAHREQLPDKSFRFKS
jgi:hypothetical protein